MDIVMKIYKFPQKPELPTFILPVKISWLIFFCGFQGGNEKFAEIRAGSLFHLAVNSILYSQICHMHWCFNPSLLVGYSMFNVVISS